MYQLSDCTVYIFSGALRFARALSFIFDCRTHGIQYDLITMPGNSLAVTL